MRSLPLKYKLVLAPAIIIIPVIFVIILMLYYLNIIGQQNDSVRNWAHTTDQIRIALTSSEQLQKITEQLQYTQSSENEELIFNYIELSRVLNENLTNPVLRNKVQLNTLKELQNLNEKIKFKEPLALPLIETTLSALIPKLEQLYYSLQAQKRAIYIDSNEYVKDKTSTLAQISVSVLVLCVLLGVILSLWISRTTTAKIKQLAQNANFVCDLTEKGSNPGKNFDDLEDIALCLSIISNRMLNTIAAEKLLQGVEDERSRIAMDIHDQFLSDLNIFKRDLNLKFSNAETTPLSGDDFQEINTTLDEFSSTLRGIIDDLYPQTLNMFGLEAALRSYLERKLSTTAHPDYYINIEKQAEKQLSSFQKLSLFRIILEAIQNIIRHAHCSRYEIDLRIANDQIVLSIEDNGIGMHTKENAEKNSHGIFNIKQRAYSIKAQVQWGSSRFSSGTQVLITLPVQLTNSNKIPAIDISASPHAKSV